MRQILLILTYLCLIVVLSIKGHAKDNCVGKFVNPLTDICWECTFPWTIGGMTVKGGGIDTANPKKPICFCKAPPRIGIPISFWEPVRLIDITRTPFCMISLGGIVMGPKRGVKGRGSVGTRTYMGGMKHSFYQVHYYIYPISYILELITDFLCLEHNSYDVAYITELDPLWNDDETSFLINPEAVLFGNPIAQAACAADCVTATLNFSHDWLFWCSGCQGSLYPFTGSTPAHSSGIQASLLLTGRFLAKLHRQLLAHGYIGVEGLCDKYPMPIIRKSQYKVQMTYPIPDTKSCHPLGRSDLIWSIGKHVPVTGEDFAYLIWRKRNCCLL